MNRRLLCLLMALMPAVGYAQQLEVVEVVGFGRPASAHASLDVKKQEAFVAAIVTGARTALEDAHGVHIHSIMTVQDDKKTEEKILSTSEGRIGAFEIDAQAMVDGVKWDILEDIVNCTYEGQRIVVKLNRLIFPPVNFLTFPKWENPPKSISGIDIKKVDWEWDQSIGDWTCLVALSYAFDPSRVRKGEGQQGGGLTFEYQKDASGDYVFQKVTLDGAAYGGGDDPPDAVRKRALDEALRNAVEKVNGVYIESLSQVEDAVLTKDEIISRTLGVAKVLDRKFTPRFTSEGNYEVVCTVTANVPIMILVPESP